MESVVYRNLNRAKAGLPDAWSIATLLGNVGKGAVERYAETVTLHRVRFRVQPAAQRRVFAGSSVRTVHAWAIGTIVDAGVEDAGVELTYNPRRRGDFHTRDGRTVVACEWLRLGSDGRCWAHGEIQFGE